MTRRPQTSPVETESSVKPDGANERRATANESDDDRIVFSSWDAALVPASPRSK